MKTPLVGQTVLIKNANPTEIIAVYDGVNASGKKPIYSVKVHSGDVYDVVADGQNWRAIR